MKIAVGTKAKIIHNGMYCVINGTFLGGAIFDVTDESGGRYQVLRHELTFSSSHDDPDVNNEQSFVDFKNAISDHAAGFSFRDFQHEISDRAAGFDW